MLQIRDASSVSLVLVRNSISGKVEITIDNTPVETFDLFARQDKYGALAGPYNLAPDSTHTLTLRVTGKKRAASDGTFVNLDQIRVGAVASPTETPGSTTAEPTVIAAVPATPTLPCIINENDVCVTRTPTPTRTFTPSKTPTKTPTPPPTNTFTPTPTYTPLPTSTFTPTRTNTPLPTNTFTPTRTNTPLPTNTFTPTFTYTPLPTNTFTPTSTYTPTDTPTNTATFTPTFTDTPTDTATFTPTMTETPTETATDTPTLTETPTVTPTPSQTLDSFALINQDLVNGIIDINQATEYKIYALFTNLSLPQQYQSDVPLEMDHFAAYAATMGNWDQLNPATQQTLTEFLTPTDLPSVQGELAPIPPGRTIAGCELRLVKTTAHFWIWYATSGPCVTPTTASTVDLLALGFEDAYSMYANMGYSPPNLTQVFLVPLTRIRIQGQPELKFANAITLPTMILFNTNLREELQGGGTELDLTIRATAAHEFFHTLQWTYLNPLCQKIGQDPFSMPYAWIQHEDLRWWMESSAQWIQHQVYSGNPNPEDKSYYTNRIQWYLLQPWYHLDTRFISRNPDPENLMQFPYGSFLFPTWWVEHLAQGAGLIKTTWEQYSLLNAGCGPMMPVLQAALATQNTSIEQVFPGFAETNYSLAYQKEDDFRNELGPNFRPRPWTHPLNEQVLAVNGPDPAFGGKIVERLGAAYIEFDNGFGDSAGRALSVMLDIYIDTPTVDPVVKVWAVDQYSPQFIAQSIAPNFQFIETIGNVRHYRAKAGISGFDSLQRVAVSVINPQSSGAALAYTYSATVIPPVVIYAGGHSKGMISTNSGVTWTSFTFPNNVEVQVITSVANTQGLRGFAGASDLQLWKTVDAGIIFTPMFDFTTKVPIANPATSGYKIALVEVDPHNENVVYVGVRWHDGAKWDFRDNYGALFKSIDGGQTFSDDILTHNGSVWVDGAIYSLAIDPTNSNVVYVGNYAYNNLPQQVIKSLDGGATWSLMGGFDWTNNGGATRVKISPVDSSSIFALTGENQGHGIYHSNNGGIHWTRIAQPLNGGQPGGQWGGFYGLVPSKINKDNATASGSEFTSHTVAHTIDAYLTWQIINNTFGPNDLEGHWSVEDVLYAPHEGGVRWTFDGGYIWWDLPIDFTTDVSITKY